MFTALWVEVTLLFVIIWTIGLNLDRKLGGFFMLLQYNEQRVTVPGWLCGTKPYQTYSSSPANPLN